MENKKIIKETSYDPKTGIYTIEVDREAAMPAGDTYAERFVNAIINFLNATNKNRFTPGNAEHVK